MRQNITVDHIEKTITFSKAFYKKASNPKTAEYRLADSYEVGAWFGADGVCGICNNR